MAAVPDIRINIVLDGPDPAVVVAQLESILRGVRDMPPDAPEPPAEPFPEDIEVEAALDQLARSNYGLSSFSNTAELARALTATIRQRREDEPRG